MSQNVWATIMPFAPVTQIFYWPKNIFRTGQRLALIPGTGRVYIYIYIHTCRSDLLGIVVTTSPT